MLPSSLAVLMTLLLGALHSLDVAAICSSLSRLPAALCTLVVADWYAVLRFLGFFCSTSLTCRARAGGAAVAMTCGVTLSSPGVPFQDAGGCPGGRLIRTWSGGMSIVVKAGWLGLPRLVVVDWHVPTSRKWQTG